MSGALGEGQPFTDQGSVDGTQTGAYSLPQIGRFVVDAVYVTIDASGSGDVNPELTMLNAAGVVIATKAQSQAVTGGSPGSATWARRLTDETAGATPGGSGLFYVTDNEGDWFFARANVGEVNRDGDGTSVVSWEFSTGNSGFPILFSNDGGFWVDTAGSCRIQAGSGVDFTGSSGIDAGGNTIFNLANGVNPQDAATVAQLGTGGVTSIDGGGGPLTGAVTLSAGSGIGLGTVGNDITIAATGAASATIIRGSVDSAGVTRRGVGFTSARIGLGTYTIAFASAFASAPIVVSSGEDVNNYCHTNAVSLTGAGFELNVANAAGSAAQDTGFAFVAIGV